MAKTKPQKPGSLERMVRRSPADQQIVRCVWGHMCGYNIDGTARLYGDLAATTANWNELHDMIGSHLGELDKVSLAKSKPELMRKIRRILRSPNDRTEPRRKDA